MGGLQGDLSIPHLVVMHRGLTLKGKWMYSRENVRDLIKMVEAGLLKLGEAGGQRFVGKYGLEEWKEAFDAAEALSGTEDFVVIVP
jgi:threonine dehydrogenase-like Zn-dependent dehydrogenase